MTRARTSILFMFLLILASSSFAREFYESYDEGIKAVKAKDWDQVIQKMTEAINANSTENNKARSYGTNFFSYHPFYYRGVAYFNKTQYQKALEDFGRATGEGAEKLGSVDAYITRAETRMAAGQSNPTPAQPAPIPTPTPRQAPPVPIPTPTPRQAPPIQTPTPSPSPNPSPRQPAPSIDPALGSARSRAERLMSSANQRMSAARSAKADVRAQAEYGQGQQLLMDARSRSTAASSAMDWTQVAEAADRAVRTFDSAIDRARIATSNDRSTPAAAAEDVLKSTKSRLQRALDFYFSGQYQDSAVEFERLSKDQSNNAMVWAFLGASRYYAYLLDGELDSSGKQGAVDAFKRARKIKPSLDLSNKYFSPRIRKFYASTE